MRKPHCHHLVVLEIAQKTEPKKKAPEVESRPQEIGLALVPRVALLESAGCAPPNPATVFCREP